MKVSKKQSYSALLSHPNWFKKREEVFEVQGRKCARCGIERDLNVHHKRYEKGLKPWEYKVTDFEVLCDTHHAKAHGFEPESKFCINSDCPTKPTEIRGCYKYCFTCSQSLSKLLEAERLESKELRDQLDKELTLKNSTNEQKEKLLQKKNRLIDEQNKRLKQLNSIVGELKHQISDNIHHADSNEDVSQLKAQLNEFTKKSYVYEGEQAALKEQILELEDEKNKNDQTMRHLVIILALIVLALVFWLITSSTQKEELPIILQAPPVVTEEKESAADASSSFNLARASDFTDEYIDSEAVVYQVTETSGGTIFLNLGGKFPKQLLTLVIFEADRVNIPDVPLEGSRVRFSGIITTYKGQPRIIIRNSGQIIKVN